jgi:hypothetical protein
MSNSEVIHPAAQYRIDQFYPAVADSQRAGAQSESLNCANDPTTLEVCVRATWASAASGPERNDKGAAFPLYD